MTDSPHLDYSVPMTNTENAQTEPVETITERDLPAMPFIEDVIAEIEDYNESQDGYVDYAWEDEYRNHSSSVTGIQEIEIF